MIQEVIDKIVRHYDPDQIVLFGSWAKGKNTDRSDMDLIVVKDTDTPRDQRGVDLRARFFYFPVPIDFFFYTREELAAEGKRDYSFIHEAYKAGKVVYNKTPSRNSTNIPV